MNRLLALAGAALVAGCLPQKPPLPPPPQVEPEPALDPAHTAPTGDEILTYLDGKQLPLPNDDRPLRLPRGAAGPAASRTIALERAKVTALEVDPAAARTDDQPWDREVRFLYADGRHTYAVIGHILHRRLDGRIAFFGFDVTEVARQ